MAFCQAFSLMIIPLVGCIASLLHQFHLYCLFSSTFSDSSSLTRFICFKYFSCFKSMWKWYSSLQHIPLRHFSSYFFLLQFSAKLYIFLLQKRLLFVSFTLVPAHFTVYRRYKFCLNIQILIRLNFSDVSQGKHCIADITKKCFVCFVTKFGKGK